jgi:tetratricopeptide (TPR) repeat protein
MKRSEVFHMAELDAWPMIEKHGLLSVTGLLDLLAIGGRMRERLESDHRPTGTELRDAEGGIVVIRDQGPLSLKRLQMCLTDMTVIEWLRLLNRKVFFWPSERRVTDLLAARAYRDRQHLVLVIDTASLLAVHKQRVTLSTINTGATIFDAPLRGSKTMVPIDQFREGVSRIAEVAVDYAVPDLSDHLCRVEIRQAGQQPELAKYVREPTQSARTPARSSNSRPGPSADEAIARQERIVADNPLDVPAPNRLARAYADGGREDEAIGAFARVLKLEPGNTIARERLKTRIRARQTGR